ncbi:MAG: methionyl-tRNA formyltransferase [Candidatus Niyogibacteria bacterium CG10_big_fil_rev_8_21_14_0_10_46_36]|uniref:Methionyl-tRNA formyltransferase n=1 Tax=Candidatus Niyogibacteria bacterium CG10_big_fil_rev_8_21_14_0_10_46_36 TaxID=1974726 RepID=A0A2H0TGB5_9BACT|nr:MAG: methionyl-tRNA formyltransferase [Candidatus Niyogibacteria bacterium CG10_big_fil_rev_8_21_14_0_10_46_36]
MIKIIFFGTSSFGIPALEILEKAGMAPLLIVSTPDKPKGRKLQLSPSPVRVWAEEHSIPVITPSTLKDRDAVHAIQEKHADVFVVASYGKIIPKEILNIPPKGTINIHPSLLPLLRGPSPIQTAILKNAETGATLMLTDEEVDHGPILAQQALEAKNLSYPKLEQALAELGARMLADLLPAWVAGEITPKEQDHEKATYTKKIKKEDGHIDWKKSGAAIEREVRALNPWPGTYTFTDGKTRLIITKAHIENTSEKHPPGTVIKTKNGDFAIAASDTMLVIDSIKPEGKQNMTGKDFLRGNSFLSGEKLT